MPSVSRPGADVVHGHGLLQEHGRMPEGVARDEHAEPDARRARRDGGEQRPSLMARVGGRTVGIDEVVDEPRVVEASSSASTKASSTSSHDFRAWLMNSPNPRGTAVMGECSRYGGADAGAASCRRRRAESMSRRPSMARCSPRRSKVPWTIFARLV
jgi:hypothetical protein